MTDVAARAIVDSAISANDLCGLLLGRDPYGYLPPGSPSPENTDLAVLLAALYDDVKTSDRTRVRRDYEMALRKIVETKDGIGPTARAILFETFRRAKSRSSMDIPLDELAAALKHSIDRHRDALSRDFSGPGRGWENGWLGELGRLSKLSLKYGGPTFV